MLVSKRFAGRVPAGTVALVTPQPYEVFAQALARLYPSAMRPLSSFGAAGVSPGSSVHPTARLEHNVTVDPGAVIGPEAEIGSGTVIGAHAVIGPQVRIGRECSIGTATVLNAFLGNRVILHPGVRVGQDGFGFAMGPRGHKKVPQIGRVIIQDDVEIGSNTTVDRGASRDTVIGEGTKIDNLVQIGHNVVVGRHCVIISQTGISGYRGFRAPRRAGRRRRSCPDRGRSPDRNVNSDVPRGARWGGTPAKPIRDWFREMTTLKNLASRPVLAKDDGAPAPE